VACGAPGRETEKPAPGVNSRAEGQRRAFSDRLKHYRTLRFVRGVGYIWRGVGGVVGVVFEPRISQIARIFEWIRD